MIKDLGPVGRFGHETLHARLQALLPRLLRVIGSQRHY